MTNVQVLLAGTEHDLTVQAPVAVRVGTDRAEPPPAVTVPPDAENPRTAARVGNRLHGQPKNVSAWLILKSQPRTILGLTELAHFLDASEQLGGGRVLGETQIPNLHPDEGHLMRLGRRLERRLAHDVLGPVADVATGVDKPLEQLVLGQPADHDRLPDDHGLCQQTLSKVHFVLDALEDG